MFDEDSRKYDLEFMDEIVSELYLDQFVYILSNTWKEKFPFTKSCKVYSMFERIKIDCLCRIYNEKCSEIEHGTKFSNDEIDNLLLNGQKKIKQLKILSDFRTYMSKTVPDLDDQIEKLSIKDSI